MSDLLKSLFERRMRAVNSMREIAERGFADSEDEARYDKFNKDVSDLKRLIDDEFRAIETEKEQNTALEAALRKVGTPGREADESERRTWATEIRRQVMNGEHVNQATNTRLPGCVRSGLGEGFYLATTRMRELIAEETRTANVAPLTAGGSAGTGPELVPTQLVNELFVKLFDDSGVLQAGPRIIRTDSGNPLLFPRLTAINPLGSGAAGAGQARLAEGGAIQESEPTFDQVTLNAFKYGQYAKASNESIQDASFDVMGILGQVIGRNLANNFGQDLLTGTGSGQPNGIVPVVGSNVVTSGTGSTGFLEGTSAPGGIDGVGELLSVIQLLKPAYRKGAKWLMNDTALGRVRKLEASATTPKNNYLWAPASAPGLADSILGFPLVVDMFMASPAVNTVSVVFANFEHYYVRIVNDVRIEASTQVAFLNDQVVVRGLMRADADAIDTAAFCGYKGAAT